MPDQPVPPRPRNPTDDEVDAAIIACCTAAGAGKSIAPDDVAKSIDAENWRRHLRHVRRRAQTLCAAGRIDILRKGKPVAPELLKGIVRLRLSV